jgi:hypothetical protein
MTMADRNEARPDFNPAPHRWRDRLVALVVIFVPMLLNETSRHRNSRVSRMPRGATETRLS